jgi:tetratricopeptide (TPR) repeat protein
MKALFTGLAIYCLLLLATTALAVSDEAAERNNAGAKLIEQGKLDAAIAAFQKAIGLDPTYLPARLNLAYAYEKANRLDEAINAYRQAIDAQPQSFFAHNNLGVLYDKKGLYDAAIAEFETALQIETDNTMARKNLDIARKNKSTTEKRESQVLRAEKEAQAKPKDPYASYNVARLHAYYGNKDAALQWLARAIKQGYKDLAYLKVDPAFSGLREDRNFEQLLMEK